MKTQHQTFGRVALVVLAISLFVASCGDGDDGGIADARADQTTVASGSSGSSDGDDEGSGDAENGGGLAIPDSLTIAVVDGGTITGVTADAGFAFVTVEYPIDRYDEIVAFFREWAGTDAREWSESDTTYDDQGTTVQGTIWRAGASSVGVTHCRSTGGSGEYDATCLILNETG